MPDVERKIENLKLIEQATRDALDLADACDEAVLAIKLDDCLGYVLERVRLLAH